VPPKRAASAVFIHGLARKPAPEKLKELWLWGLQRGNPMPGVFPAPNEGLDLSARGVPQRFSYYADIFYGEDYETDFQSYYEADTEESVIAADGLGGVEVGMAAAAPVTPREKEFVTRFEAKLAANLERLPAEAKAASAGVGAPAPDDYEIASWLPGPVKQAIIKKAAMEAFYFLFDKEYTRADGRRFMVRKELRSRLVDELTRARQEAEKLVLVSHSMGTIVAYDVLRNCPECPQVDTLITLGSPLGVREVQEELIAENAADVDFPADKLGRWVNVYDPLDPICGADPNFANDYRPVGGKSVIDVKESNWGGWRHTITHYFAGSKFRSHLRDALGWS
jgi:hypothetical protein